MKTLKKVIFALLILSLLIIGGIFFIRSRNNTNNNITQNIQIDSNHLNENNDTNNGNSDTNKNNNIKENSNLSENNITKGNDTENEIQIENITTGDKKENIIINTQSEIQSITTKEILIEYENKKYHFKIGIPNTWAFQENTNGFNLKIKTPKNDTINENLGVTIQELQTKETVESFTQKTIEGLKNLYKNYKEIKRENIEIKGVKGISITYEFSDNGHDIKAKQTALLKDDKSYIFQYTADKSTFDIYIDTINNIINSITF